MIRENKAEMNNKRAIQILILVLIIISVITGSSFIKSMIEKAEAGTEQLIQMVLYDIDLRKIPDGEYEGNYKAFPVMVMVRVSVSNHSITDIKLLKHINEQGKDAEFILDHIINAQSVKVDAISGATFSSKVIQKAIETALLSSLE